MGRARRRSAHEKGTIPKPPVSHTAGSQAPRSAAGPGRSSCAHTTKPAPARGPAPRRMCPIRLRMGNGDFAPALISIRQSVRVPLCPGRERQKKPYDRHTQYKQSAPCLKPHTPSRLKRVWKTVRPSCPFIAAQTQSKTRRKVWRPWLGSQTLAPNAGLDGTGRPSRVAAGCGGGQDLPVMP